MPTRLVSLYLSLSLTHTHAAQLGLNGVSLLTYLFSATQTQMRSHNVNAAEKQFALPRLKEICSWRPGLWPPIPDLIPVVKTSRKEKRSPPIL